MGRREPPLNHRRAQPGRQDLSSQRTQPKPAGPPGTRYWPRSTRGNVALVDVRSPDEYAGNLLAPPNLPQEGAQRGGHIPGAANIPWAQAANEDGTFKSADELQQLYGGEGIDGSKETIAYCRIGERSSHTWFVLTQLLGHSNVRNYDGSWTEWGSIVGAPIEK